MNNDIATMKEFSLDVDSELRFELESKNSKVTVELRSGFAELFGTSLVRNKTYEFHTGAKVAIFTYHGCVLQVVGKMDVHYISKQTPMIQYLNCHSALEQLREAADDFNGVGPIVMVVGPTDVGKSTVCRILLNYAVIRGRRPIYVDLDVGQGNISVPGTISAMLVERPARVEDDFLKQAPLVYQFGHISPSENGAYFDILVSKLAEVTLKRLQAKKQVKSSGMVINTCGWIKGQGYRHILHAAKKFHVDAILVLDQERLYNELLRDVPKSVQVAFLQKSGGVVERSKSVRSEARDQRVREYFYGTRSPLYPHSFDVRWSDIQICKVGAPSLRESCLPLGMKPEDNKTKLVAVQPSMSLMYHLLAVTFAKNMKDDVIHSNAAGFICITKVDMKRKTYTILSPQPGPLPSTIYLLSEVQFMDSR